MCRKLITFNKEEKREGMPVEYLVSELGDSLQSISFKIVDVALVELDCVMSIGAKRVTTPAVRHLQDYYYLGLNVVRVNYECSDDELARIAFKVKEYYFGVSVEADSLEECATLLQGKVIQFVPCKTNKHKMCLTEASEEFQPKEEETIRLIRLMTGLKTGEQIAAVIG